MASNSRDEIVRFVYQTTGDQDLANTSSLLVKMADSGKLTDEETVKLTASLKGLAAQSKAVNDALSQKAALAETANQFAAAQQKAAALAQTLERTGASAKEVNRAYAASDAELARLTAQYAKQDIALQKSLGSLQKAGIDTTNLATASATLSAKAAAVAADLSRIGTAAASAATGTGTFAAALKGLSDSVVGGIAAGFSAARQGVNEFAASLLRVTGIAGAVTSALGAISVGRLFGGAVTSAKDFESALSEVRAVSGATADELTRMRDAAEDASRTTKFSATEAVTALGELARASGNATDAISELKPTLNLAQGAGLGVADAAQILTTAITQFGLAATDAARVSDLFAREANSTNDNVQSLGLSLSYVAPLAKQLGLSIEQTTATLGALAEQGFRGERAGTALRNVFSQLLDPTSQFSTALAGLGINGKDFTKIVTQLAAAGDKGKQALLALDAEARPAILALVGSGGAGIQRLTEDFKEAGGEAQRTATIMGQNFTGASARLSNAFDSIRRALVDPILAPLADQFDAVALKIDAFAKTADFAQIKAAILDFATSATDAIIKLAGSTNFTALSKSISDFAASSKQFFSDVKENVSAVGTAFTVLGGTVGTIFNGLKTVVFTGATVITGGLALVGKAALSAAEGASVLNGTYLQLAPTFKTVATNLDALVAVSKEFGTRATASADAAGASFLAVSAAISTTAPAIARSSAAMDKAGESAKTASAGIEGVGHAFDTVADRSENVVSALGILPELFDETGSAASQGLGKVATSLGEIGPTADQLRAQITQVAFQLGELQGTERDGGAEALALRDKLVQLEVQLLNVGSAASKVPVSVDALKIAFAGLKVTSQKDLDDAAAAAKNFFDTIDQGSANNAKGLADRQNAFIAYAKAALAAAANVDQATVDSTKIQLDSKASALGLSDALDKVKKSGVDAGKQTSQAFQSVPSDIQAAADAVDHVGQFSDTASRAIKKMGEDVPDALNGVTADLSNFSDSAREAFAEAQDAALQFGIHSEADLQQYVRAIDAANARINATIDAQKASADAFISSLGAMTDASLKNAAAAGGGLEELSAELQNVAANARDGSGQFSLLNEADLSRVQQAAEAAAQRVQEISDAAKQAREDLANIGSDLQDQIDQINGNQEAIEDRRAQNQLEQLKEQAEAAGLLNSAEYDDAVAKANQLHELKLKQIREEAAAQAAANSENGSAPKNSPSSSIPAGSSGLSSSPAASIGGINITVQGSMIGVGTPQQVSEQMARFLDPQLKRLARLSQ